MVPVSSCRPPSHTCTHPLLSAPFLSSSPVRGLSVLEIKALNGKCRCPGGESASDLHIYHRESPEKSRKWFTTGKEMQSMFLSSREEKS